MKNFDCTSVGHGATGVLVPTEREKKSYRSQGKTIKGPDASVYPQNLKKVRRHRTTFLRLPKSIAFSDGEAAPKT